MHRKDPGKPREEKCAVSREAPLKTRMRIAENETAQYEEEIDAEISRSQDGHRVHKAKLSVEQQHPYGANAA